MLTPLRQLLAEPTFKTLGARYLPGILATLALLVLGKLCTLGLAWFVKKLVDVLPHHQPNLAVDDPILLPVTLLLGYGIALVGSVAFNELKQMLATKLTLRFIEEIAEQTFLHILRLPFNFFVGQKSGVITRDYERGLRGIQALSELLLYSVLPTLVELAIIAIYMAKHYQASIMLTVGVSVVLHVAMTLIISGRWSIFRERYNHAESHCNQRLADCLINVESVKLFGNEALETRRFVATFRDYRQAFFVAQKYCAYLNTSQQLILAVAVVSVLWGAYHDVQRGVISVGDWVMLNALLLQVYAPLNLLGIFYKDVRQSLVDIEALVQLSKLPGEEDLGRGDVVVSEAPRISFEAIGLRYEGHASVLSDVSFTLQPHSFNAIVGHSGSGKSSLVKLLTRLVVADQGNIRLDDQAITEIPLGRLRASIGVVSQDNTLFNSTVLDNIRYGHLQATLDEVIEATQLAHVHDYIMSLPLQYATEVGERGLKMSGGQRQRIAIARALLRQPRILILDEGTSALDAATEKAVLDSIHATQRTTLIMIAHKLSNVVNADHIIVMEGGKVVGAGQHIALLESSPVYQQLWTKQRHAN